MTSPVLDPDETPPTMPRPPVNGSSRSPVERVYLVDEDPAVLRVAAEILDGSGYEIQGLQKN